MCVSRGPEESRSREGAELQALKSYLRETPGKAKGPLPSALQQEELPCREPETEGGSGNQAKVHCPGQVLHIEVSQSVGKRVRENVRVSHRPGPDSKQSGRQHQGSVHELSADSPRPFGCPGGGCTRMERRPRLPRACLLSPELGKWREGLAVSEA